MVRNLLEEFTVHMQLELSRYILPQHYFKIY